MMQRYAEYKDSGVEWIGEIPVGWGTAKLKFIASLYNGDSLNEDQKKSYESDDTTVGYAYISSKDITAETSSIDYKNGLRIPKEHTKFKLTPKKTSLICIEGGSAGRKIAFTRENVCFVNKLACVDTKQCHYPKYTFYLLKSGPFQKQFYSSMTGLIGGVAISNIKNFELMLPPLPEQTAIAGFLDDKTAKIDELVGIKRRQIALLGERKQILIQNAVTKGLNPDAPMKDSGVDWIGKIPAHWEVKRFRYLFDCGKGLTITKENLQDEGVPCVNYGEIHSKYGFELDPEKNPLKAVSHDYLENSVSALLDFGDFIFADTSEDLEGSGNFTYLNSDQKVFAGYHTVIARPKAKMIYRHLAYFFDSMSYRSQMRRKVKGVKVYSITQSIIKGTHVILPPEQEQKEIARFLDIETGKINAAITIKQNQITKLNEYKTMLINAAVTGKIKVV